jgi:hypothetical protein
LLPICAAYRPNATRRWPRCTRGVAPCRLLFRDISVREAKPPAPPTEVPSPADPAAPPAWFSTLTAAEQYAVLYPDRAARIRAGRGLPPTSTSVHPSSISSRPWWTVPALSSASSADIQNPSRVGARHPDERDHETTMRQHTAAWAAVPPGRLLYRRSRANCTDTSPKERICN